MANITQVEVNGTTYDICDATARDSINQLQEVVVNNSANGVHFVRVGRICVLYMNTQMSFSEPWGTIELPNFIPEGSRPIRVVYGAMSAYLGKGGAYIQIGTGGNVAIQQWGPDGMTNTSYVGSVTWIAGL